MKREIISILSGQIDIHTLKLITDMFDTQHEEIMSLRQKVRHHKKRNKVLKDNLTGVSHDLSDRRAVTYAARNVRINDISHVYFNPELRKFSVRGPRLEGLEGLELVGVYSKPYDTGKLREDLWYMLNDAKETIAPLN